MTTKKPTQLPKKKEGRWVTTDKGTTYWKGPAPTPLKKQGAIDDSGNPIFIIDKQTGKKRQATYGELGPKTKKVK